MSEMKFKLLLSSCYSRTRHSLIIPSNVGCKLISLPSPVLQTSCLLILSPVLLQTHIEGILPEILYGRILYRISDIAYPWSLYVLKDKVWLTSLENWILVNICGFSDKLGFIVSTRDACSKFSCCSMSAYLTYLVNTEVLCYEYYQSFMYTVYFANRLFIFIVYFVLHLSFIG